MSNCENCGAEQSEDHLHLVTECFTNLNNKIEQLEDENRGLKQAIESYKRQLRKTNAAVPPHPV